MRETNADAPRLNIDETKRRMPVTFIKRVLVLAGFLPGDTASTCCAVCGRAPADMTVYYDLVAGSHVQRARSFCH